ncbi:MAG: hypothetical protein COA57_07785 [Flavobacteriales bacterium]|nr:MAG: hypothetical protein COA57_07785 [Flavobacteriales bacterium]
MRFITLCVCALGVNALLAQPLKQEVSFKQRFSRATTYMFDQNFNRALHELLILDSLLPDNANIAFQIGYCYLQPPVRARKAIEYLERSSASTTKNYKEGYYKEDKAPVEALKYLADAYHKNYEFDISIATYERFKQELHPNDVESVKEIERQVEMCREAAKLKETPVHMTVTNLGGKINSKFADYRAVVNADESLLIFTSRKRGSTGSLLTDDGRYFEDIFIAEKQDDGSWGEPQPIGATINTSDHEATVGISADGQTLLIYKYDEEGQGDLYSSKLVGDRWTVPQRLGSNINTEFWEPHATISADGQYLYFTSNREGGFGSTDIYFCKKLPTGEWGLAQNCGAIINTPYPEDSPFFHPDGTTLFFSSRGHNSMGGFDIYFSERLEEKKWTKPHNMGYPVNTPGDDIFFMPTTDGKRAYYSSFRSDGFGDQDIYMITFPEFKEIPLTVFKGTVKDAMGNVPEDVFITVTDNETGDLVGNYIPNMMTGKYIIILKPGSNYNITYEGEDLLFHSENLIVPEESNYYEISKAIELQPITVGSTVELKNIFFDYASAHITSASYVELEKVYKTLKNSSHLKIEISGHTDSKGEPNYNMKLSQDRAQAIVDHLVEQGIEKGRLVAKGYGETKPHAPNTNEDGSDNPEGRAKNRRIEMKILEK